ncbi:DNA/RNA polymerase [Poronia punctata]|nr:DNA/RNA polymerase [Poronia punctata]
MHAIESTRPATRWITRIVPVLLSAAVGFATYVVVVRVCVDYLLRFLRYDGAAIAILVIHFVFLLLMIATYARTIYHAIFNPGVVPLGPRAIKRRNAQKRKKKGQPIETPDLESGAYNAHPDDDPDSPGLEDFYSRDVFVCETDGRPRWCTECCNWKPDRAHHSSEIGRCVYRMDHYCPWVGGMIGETSFKFFVQFTTYASLYCALVLGSTAYTLRRQISHGSSPDPYLIAAIAISAFFGLFAFLMTVTSMRYVFLNMTNVEILGFETKSWQLAVRVPRGTRSDKFGVVVYPLPNEANDQRYTVPATSRDDLATRTFAVLATEGGAQENPWDLGFWRNWQTVMGTNPFDWLFPIRSSPCTNHESHESYYPMGPVLDKIPSPNDDPERGKSRFTYRHLALLASYSTSSPLRVIAHIDLDAFYAQCEMVRLGIDEDQPLAVQQWQGLIAINYPARKFGIGRHCTVTEAKKLCPNLIAQHVATWKEGEEKWAYRDDAASHIGTHKVSLDPYRLQSRKILALIKQCLPPDMQKVEKASIDEVFIDLSAQIHSILLQRFPELSNPPPYDDPTEKLPPPPITALDWQADALVDLDDAEAEVDNPDWDDVAILIGSEIVRDIRAEILRTLHYTCSAGIASNKMLSKIGSGYKKPNQQTVIRNRAVGNFLSDMKFTKIRNLGGKLGDQVKTAFNTELVKEMLPVSLEQLKLKLGEETGVWFYNTIRGIDASEVTSRTQIKSMLSAKSFQPAINNMEQAAKWLRIFAADIFSRLVEEGILEHKRRPKTIHLHHRSAGQTRSRSSSLPQGKSLDEAALFNLARHMLTQIVNEGRAWPCANLSLSVGGFEEGVTGNMGISTFLIKGDEAHSPKVTSREAPPDLSLHEPLGKKRRIENAGIQRFFSKGPVSSGGKDGDNAGVINLGHAQERMQRQMGDSDTPQIPTNSYMCSRCDMVIEDPVEIQNHNDWHMAKDLQEEERGNRAFVGNKPAVPRSQKKATSTPPRSSSRGGGSSSGGGERRLEPGQSKLKFG